MIKKTIENYGANKIIVLNACAGLPEDRAAELRLYVNRLFNYGVVSNIPDDYNEGKDTTVMLQTGEERLTKGLRAMAETDLRKEDENLFTSAKGSDGSAVLAKIDARVASMMTEFVPTDPLYDNQSKIHSYRQGLIENLGWAQETVRTG